MKAGKSGRRDAAGQASYTTGASHRIILTGMVSISPELSIRGRAATRCDVTILMPCLNEAATLPGCLSEAMAYLAARGIAGEVLVADNGSTDGSQQLARDAGARVIDVPLRGYGSALSAGIRDARGHFVVMGDADASYDFSSLDPFLSALSGGADLVVGNRFQGGVAPGAMPPLHRYVGNPVLSGVGRLLFRSPVRDFHCGLRSFRRDRILALDLQTTGMEFASEMVVRSTLEGLRIVEVPTTLSPDGRGRPPHLRSWHDGWRHLRFLLLFSPRWLFLYPGLLAVALGLIGMAALASELWTPGHGRLAEGLIVAAGALTIVGAQTVQVATTARDFGVRQRLLPPADSRLHRQLSAMSLERTLILSALLVSGGLLLLAVSLVLSTHSDPTAIRASAAFRLGAVGVTLGVVGTQLAVGGWMRSLLQLPQRGTTISDQVAVTS